MTTTGGGSPGDSTGVLQTFIEAGLEDACILYIVDPEAVEACQEAGVGATLTLDVGAKSTPLQGQPVRMDGGGCDTFRWQLSLRWSKECRLGEQHGSLGIYPTGRGSCAAGDRAGTGHSTPPFHGRWA